MSAATRTVTRCGRRPTATADQDRGRCGGVAPGPGGSAHDDQADVPDACRGLRPADAGGGVAGGEDDRAVLAALHPEVVDEARIQVGGLLTEALPEASVADA